MKTITVSDETYQKLEKIIISRNRGLIAEIDHHPHLSNLIIAQQKKHESIIQSITQAIAELRLQSHVITEYYIYQHLRSITVPNLSRNTIKKYLKLHPEWLSE